MRLVAMAVSSPERSFFAMRAADGRNQLVSS